VLYNRLRNFYYIAFLGKGTGFYMKTVAEFVFLYLADCGVRHVFLVVGGGAMFLNDALRKEKRIKAICNHHEQASAIAAEGYSRINGELSVVSVTSGPGGTNTITGVLGQWTDSVPVLYLSGQVKRATNLNFSGFEGLRQLGDQEVNIIKLVKSITKYADVVREPTDIKWMLQKAVHEATTGRFGPVWLDIPVDIQSSKINEDELIGYECEERTYGDFDVHELIGKATKPLIIAGHGIRLSNSVSKFRDFISRTNIPVVTTFNGFDAIPSDARNFYGRIGTIGNVVGNKILQKADLLICLGTRNNIRQIGYNIGEFGANASKIIVDIDQHELEKCTIVGDVLLNCDVSAFIDHLARYNNKCGDDWVRWCDSVKLDNPILSDKYYRSSGINPYVFCNKLTERLNDDEIVVVGNGTVCVAMFQTGVVKSNSRIVWNSGNASMGYALPASIGASMFGRRVICLTGDGSLQMNVQELETIHYNNLPIKIFVFANGGYHSIIESQSNHFGRLVGCTRDSGLSLPDLSSIAPAYGIKFFRVFDYGQFEEFLPEIIEGNSPALCEVVLSDYVFTPKASAKVNDDGSITSSSLERME